MGKRHRRHTKEFRIRLANQSMTQEQRAVPYGRCENCRRPLGIPKGYGGTLLCGPCATGEAETLAEQGRTW